MTVTQFVRRTFISVVGIALIAGNAFSAATCESPVGQLVSTEGRVEIQRAGDQLWHPGELDESLCRNDTIRVGKNSRAAVALVNDAILRLDQNTTIRLLSVAEEEEEPSLLSLIAGAFQSFSRKPRELAVNTPYLNASIEGTEFVLRVEQAQTRLTVLEGRVLAANDFGEAVAARGETVVAEAGRAPERRIVVRPRDAAQWSIYYPPVIAVLGGGDPPADLPAALRDAAAMAGQGNAAGALDAMARVPPAQRDGRWYLYRAAFLLAAGRVDDARVAIDAALRADPDNALAYAQRTVIDVAQNRTDAALESGTRAVALAPESTAARIAHSYALQAAFRLGEARQTLQAAVAANPNDALAHARLAELWMMIGYRGRARAEAGKAVALAPNLERAQVVFGFAALVEIRTKQARAAFEKAIALDSDDPLPHLGLGLAMIRDGNLAAGRKQIEVAVGLDSQSALLRAYLGKAYFEEKRDPLDGEQLAMAKEFDPLDPTAYLYDAIRKQSENRPGEALHDLQKSIELNDNRAVYRGRLQLDEDRAARGASLARVYSDLGFYQQGLNEATKSLADDPTNPAAHRFLSDSYADMPRRGIARVSEQLQAQMLQDININPVSPSSNVANLNTSGGGAAGAGFNEYTALFERNQLQLDARGEYGNNDTWSGEGVVSAVYDWLSISAGGYHYETEGWRDNHGIEHDIQNAYVQAAITPTLNLQLEYSRRETVFGDIDFDFDPDDFLQVNETTLEQDLARAGVRWSPSPNSDVLVSFIYGDTIQGLTEFEPNGFAPGLDLATDVLGDDEGYQAETQYLYRGNRVNLTAGLAHSEIGRNFVADFTIFSGGVPIGVLPPLVDDSEIIHSRGYTYLDIKIPAPVTWTVGASYDHFEQDALDLETVNPKFGVRWDVTDRFSLRGAYTKTVKPALVSNRTLEATQVAGFNQLFDDVNATESTRYGGGLDWRATDNLAVGVESTWRDLEIPVVGVGTVRFEDADEIQHRAYLNWLPLSELALSGEVIYDRFRAARANPAIPATVRTVTVPIAIRFTHSSGFFASIGGTYIDQDVERSAGSTRAEGRDSFAVVDAGLGWRFPNRLGTLGLSVHNLLDEEFNYQDDGYREFSAEPSTSSYVPERIIMGQLTLKF